MHVTEIRFIVFDVDGVLTDGAIILDDLGHESKRFHVRDGFAIKAAMSMGIKVGVITGRTSRVVTLRMAELGIDLLVQGAKDKAAALETLCAQAGVEPGETAYMGDDLIDLPPMLRCGYPMAVADAAAEVRDVAKFVTRVVGGRGAAREAIEHILKAKGKWDAVVEKYGV
ncbi:MAG: HAD-IIIA family hydrolase [Planctomycetota bacterium]|nr:HAD-IIIA family hydrolase [Planctomycetota bacterium]